MTDIFDFEIALAYLEDAGWNLMNAVSIFTSQQQNPATATASGSNSSTSTGSNVPKSQPPAKVSQNLIKKSVFLKTKISCKFNDEIKPKCMISFLMFSLFLEHCENRTRSL